MRINGSGVYLHPTDQEILGISHTDHYPLWLIRGHLVDIAQDSLTRSVEAEIGRFDELRDKWDTVGHNAVEEAFERGRYDRMPTARLAGMLMTLECVAREQ
jgi:hypothetical protein